MLLWSLFIARAPVTEIMLGENARFFEQAHRSIHGGDGDVGIDRSGPVMNSLDIGMVGCFRQHACDDASLLSHLETLLDAQLLERGLAVRHARTDYTRRAPRYS